MTFENNKKIIELLGQIENLLLIKGVAFKPKAYQNAAQSLENLEENISDIYKQNGLKGLEKIPNIGKSIAKKIGEFLKNG